MNFSSMKNELSKIVLNSPNLTQLQAPFWELYCLLQEKNWHGWCHGSSCVLYMIFRELGYPANLCIGVVSDQNNIFDHSWVEIDEQIFDVAISLPDPRSGLHPRSPVFSGHNLNESSTTVLYGLNSDLSFPASEIAQLTIAQYIENAPANHPIPNLFSLTQEIATRCNIKTDIGVLSQKYGNNKRQIIKR